MRASADGSRLGAQLERANQALSTLQLAMEKSSETSKPNMIEEMRSFVHQTSKLLSCAQTSLALRIALDNDHQRTTRTNYLLPLNERIGPEPETGTWEDEWHELRHAKYEKKARQRCGSLLEMVDSPRMATRRGARSPASGPLDVIALVRDPNRAKELLLHLRC